MRSITVILIIAFASTIKLNAQNRTITGRIEDAKDGSPIAGALIHEFGTKNVVLADAHGNFFITIKENATRLSISFQGYERTDIAIKPQEDQGIIKLSQKAYYQFYDPYPRLSVGYYGGINYSFFGVLTRLETWLERKRFYKKLIAETGIKTNFEKNRDYFISLNGLNLIEKRGYGMNVLISYRSQKLRVHNDHFINRNISAYSYHALGKRTIKSFALGATYRDLNGQEAFLKQWGSIIGAAMTLNLKNKNTYKNLLIKTKTSLGGYIIIFKDDIQYCAHVYRGFKLDRYQLGLEYERIKNYKEFKVSFRYVIYNRPAIVESYDGILESINLN